jgi:hypothetical protein
MVSRLRLESTVSGSSLQEFTADSLLFTVPEARFATFGQNSMISAQIQKNSLFFSLLVVK